MATLSVDRRSGKVVGYNVQWHEGKRRRTIHLGGKRYTKKTAERFKEIVEAFLFYRRNGITTPEKPVENWLQKAPTELWEKLAKAGFITVDEQKTCQQLWDTFLKHKTDIKPKTMDGYRDSQVKFFEVFLPSEPVGKITADRLLEWKTLLLSRYATASVAGYMKNVKAVLNWAVRQDWIAKNPMNGITRGSFRNKDKDRIITMEEYFLLLNACPNQEWRVIVALARIGGLRCPSELQQLRWSDVDWTQNRFVVRSPKTEQHAGHGERMVPLFPDLRVELQKHFSDNENEFVIQSYQRTNWSLYEPFQKIVRKAGLEKVVRPFDNMRMSRSNEVVRQYGEIKESLWIGHTQKVMQEHYYQLTDEDFADAAGEAA